MKCAARDLIGHVQAHYSASDEKQKWKKTHPLNYCLAATHRARSERGAMCKLLQGKEWSQPGAPPGSLVPTASKEDFFTE